MAGRYRLLEYLATGGAAVLWRAHDEQLGRRVALKILQPQYVADETAVERFRREGLAIAALRHPNIVRIFDAEQHEDIPFLVVEYIDGPTLSDFEGQRLDPDIVTALGYELAEALGAAHRRDLIHRDVKPGNVVFDLTSGRAKLLDFGITKDLRDDAGLTDPKQVVATIRYAAPEQVSGDDVGPWTDVYCLGLVLWEACTGQPAFDAETPDAIAMARLQQDPPLVTEVVDGVPSGLAEVIRRASCRDIGDRYADGAEMAEALSWPGSHRANEVTKRLIAMASAREDAEDEAGADDPDDTALTATVPAGDVDGSFPPGGRASA
jgi:eukaryotic-like serine/threonine-protein kinase